MGSDKGARDQTGSTERSAEDARQERAPDVSAGLRLDRGNVLVDDREDIRGGDRMRSENPAREESAMTSLDNDLSVTTVWQGAVKRVTNPFKSHEDTCCVEKTNRAVMRVGGRQKKDSKYLGFLLRVQMHPECVS